MSDPRTYKILALWVPRQSVVKLQGFLERCIAQDPTITFSIESRWFGLRRVFYISGPSLFVNIIQGIINDFERGKI